MEYDALKFLGGSLPWMVTSYINGCYGRAGEERTYPERSPIPMELTHEQVVLMRIKGKVSAPRVEAGIDHTLFDREIVRRFAEKYAPPHKLSKYAESLQRTQGRTYYNNNDGLYEALQELRTQLSYEISVGLLPDFLTTTTFFGNFTYRAVVDVKFD
jgi:hypothetical protein